MSIKVGINGFGCIGCPVLRVAIVQPDVFETAGIDDLFIDLNYMVYMVKYDTTHGRFEGEIDTQDGKLLINGKAINVHAEKDPVNTPWGADGTEYVVESTGMFATKEKASAYIAVDAKKVVISVLAKDDTLTFVCGANLDVYTSDVTVVSSASCTTNCLTPLVKIINDKFGVAEGLMTAVHFTIIIQKTVDGPSAESWRGGRAASGNIIPSSMGMAKAVTLVIPELKCRLISMSSRAPILDVPVVDLTCRLEKFAIYEETCTAIKEASKSEMKGILGHTENAVVSSDFLGDPRTPIFDAEAGIMSNSNFVKLVSWHDNEWGYSNEVPDLISHMFSVDHK